MEISAFQQVISYLEEKSSDKTLLECYENLAKIVKNADNDHKSDHSAAILKEKERLKQYCLAIDPSYWGYSSYSLFEKINKNCLFGKAASDFLDSLFTSDSKDYHAIYTEINKKVKQISRLGDTLNRFQQLFNELVPSEFLQTADEILSKPTLFLYFDRNLLVQNISDLERYTRIWDEVLGAFSTISGEENNSIDITSLSFGKVVFTVRTEENTFKSIIDGVTRILPLLAVILRIKKIQCEMSTIPLSKNLHELLDEEIRVLIDQQALESAEKIISIKKNESSDEIISKETSMLAKALKQILSFIERGGRIEFKSSSSNIDLTGTNKILIDAFALAFELESLSEEKN